MSQKSYAILELMNCTQQFEVISRHILKSSMFQVVHLTLIRNDFYCFYSILFLWIVAAAVRTTDFNSKQTEFSSMTYTFHEKSLLKLILLSMYFRTSHHQMAEQYIPELKEVQFTVPA